MCKELISVVIPIYNVEQYLRDCLQSIINQTYNNLEIILIDDGSPDNCGKICDEYEKKDSRIKVIHKKNGGLSDARNYGLKLATGKYITFIDSDDYVDMHFIEYLYSAIKRTNADISFCDYTETKGTMDLNTEKLLYDNFGEEVYNNLEMLKQLYIPQKHGYEFVAWGKLYKTELFTKNNIFYPVGKLHEDTFTTYKLIYYAKKICSIDYKGYYYRIRSGSIMTSEFNIKRFDMMEATRMACTFFEDKKEVSTFNLAVNLHFNTIMKLYYMIENNYNKEDKKELQNKVIDELKVSLKKYKKITNMGVLKKCFWTFASIRPNSKIMKLRYDYRDGE